MAVLELDACIARRQACIVHPSECTGKWWGGNHLLDMDDGPTLRVHLLDGEVEPAAKLGVVHFYLVF